MERPQSEYHDLFTRPEKKPLTPAQYKLDNRVRNERAISHLNLFDFIKQLERICTAVLPKVIVIPDDEIGKILNPKQEVKNTYITYQTNLRKPLKEKKPMERHEFLELTNEENEARIGTLYAQRFYALVEFSIIADGYTLAEETMDKFEGLMLNYASSFKEYGITEMYLHEQIRDEHYDTYRQIASVRNLIYAIYFEKQEYTFDQVINSVNTELNDVSEH